MGNPNVREPKQKRSVEKKNRIIQAGFALFTDKGYHNTNTMEIAQSAGVSVGTVYSYFGDKKAIFMAALHVYCEVIMNSVYHALREIQSPIQYREVVDRIISLSMETHSATRAAHDEMMSMTYQDEDVRQLMKEFEEKSVLQLAELLRSWGLELAHPHEKIHLAFNLIEVYCHEAVYHRHDFIDYDVLKRDVVSMVVSLFGVE
ncbi:MAG: transcriptional regulator [Paenibacillaceae bacterium]|jgi:AcrR family transcriptional regulator|nr:transcriptional regulator [Paenibacillaceae bacterium]